MGASAGILAASMDSRVKAVVSFSAFDDPQKISSAFLRCLRVPNFLIRLNFIFITRWLGRPIENVAPINVIKNIKSPILLIHGLNDKIVLPQNSERLYNKSNKLKTEKLFLQNGDHHRITRYPTFIKYVISFFKKSFESDLELRVKDKIPLKNAVTNVRSKERMLSEIS